MGRQIDQLSLLFLQFKTVTGPLSPNLRLVHVHPQNFYFVSEKHSCTGGVPPTGEDKTIVVRYQCVGAHGIFILP
jgi:hypothetical protein